ncbi:polysaccharide biosynthesis family protein [Escherichia coli MP021017.5]|uniref:O-antigen flippase n=2 Tax=Escherichia coli TaxID=562 RepID=A0A0D3QU86_ECOLX|nr:O65 family O-antigen flippase [Escherichia coli]AJR19396.1 O-antigen flippase [Escherichia coli]EFH3245301.1 O65 family O-antigen flippase [Escherichia coli]EMU78357.1 polysaccharide biosynthesis family protein [Escherichia coli MP021017.9]EMU80833.1 polysaccharide biosynthesis family protein [Escherichia coli MP021017.6]EMU83007.1 polysaccharide biosynthesis family protein [Escherichia coli MP021017.5]
MNLIRTSLLSVISTFFRLLSALVINKAIATFIGPTGLALIGQFQNFTQIALVLAQGGINNGVVKYNAELISENKDITILNSTAIRISLLSSLFIGFLMAIFSNYLSDYIFNSPNYSYVFIIFGITIFFFVINQLLLSILNGLKEIRLFIGINISQSIYSLIFTSLAILTYGLVGALIAMVTNQSIIFITVVWRLRKHPIISLRLFNANYDKKIANKLFKYSVMALTSILTVPLTNFILRNYIGNVIGWSQAGYWQAIWYISSMYLMVITTALNIYYLPRLSEIKDKKEIKKELLNGYVLIIPFIVLLTLGIFFLKEYIVLILFNKDFYPMLELFKWQLVGDVIKISAWLLSYIMLAKAMTKEFIITEILFSMLFVIVSLIYINVFGLIGVTYGYATNYIIYFIVMFLIFRKKYLLQ